MLDKDGAICNHSLTFAVETPRYTFTQRHSPPTKRPLAAKRRPGIPRKVRRQEDWTQLWLTRWRVNNTACFECGNPMKQRKLFASLIRPLQHPSGQQSFRRRSYTAERRFEIREFALTNTKYSYQQVADAFKMPKTTLFDVMMKNPCG